VAFLLTYFEKAQKKHDTRLTLVFVFLGSNNNANNDGQGTARKKRQSILVIMFKPKSKYYFVGNIRKTSRQL